MPLGALAKGKLQAGRGGGTDCRRAVANKDMDTYINYKLRIRKLENYMMDYTFRTISKKVMGDLHTPVSIYLKVRDIYPESALLESSDFHGNENSLSFIALRPLASIGINNGECTATFPDETREVTPLTEDYNVPEAMNAFLGRFKVEGADKKVCGLFGYTAFDAVRYFENIPVMEVHHEENDAPDMLYILYKYILVFNHFKNELTLVEMVQDGEDSGLEEILTLIENRNFASYNFQTAGPETSRSPARNTRRWSAKASSTASGGMSSRSY